MKKLKMFYLSLSMAVIMLMFPLVINKQAFAGDDSLKKIIIPTDVNLSPGQMNGMSLREEQAVGDGRYRTRDDLNAQQKAALDNVLNNPVSRTVPQTYKNVAQERVDVVVPNNINLNAAQTHRLNTYQSSGNIQDKSQLSAVDQAKLQYVLTGVEPFTQSSVAQDVVTKNPADNKDITSGSGINNGWVATKIPTGQDGATTTMYMKIIPTVNQSELGGSLAGASTIKPLSSTLDIQIPVANKTINYNLFQGLSEDKKQELIQNGYKVVQPTMAVQPAIAPGTYTYKDNNYVPVQVKTISVNDVFKN